MKTIHDVNSIGANPIQSSQTATDLILDTIASYIYVIKYNHLN
jgi:hypothetical protein